MIPFTDGIFQGKYDAKSAEIDPLIKQLNRDVDNEFFSELVKLRAGSVVSRVVFIFGLGLICYKLGIPFIIALIWTIGAALVQIIDKYVALDLLNCIEDSQKRHNFVLILFLSCIAYAMIVPIGWLYENHALKLLLVVFVAGALTANALRSQRVPWVGWVASLPYFGAVLMVFVVEIAIKRRFTLFESFALIGIVLLGFSYVVQALNIAARGTHELKSLLVANRYQKLCAINANAAKSEFLATMSHEMRTPMNAILGSAALLRQAPLGDSELELVKTLETSGTGLMGLLNDLLDLSKIEAGRMDIENIAVSPFNIADEARRLWSAPMQNKGVDFSLSVGENVPPAIFGDPSRIAQIINNLLSNALKFTPIGGEVSLYVDFEGDALTFAIKDSGIGISKENKDLVFEPYKQASTSTTRKFGGTGLGLATARRLAHLMGGDIELESELGHGAVFTLILRPKLADVGEIKHVEEKIAVEDFTGHQDLSILAADDNEANRFILQRFLEPLGCETVFVEDGQEAFDMSLSRKFDVILLDVRMPNMDGLEACRAIRNSNNVNSDTPIILVSADASTEHTQMGHEVGANAYLTKPIDIQKLYSMIDLAISGGFNGD